MEEAEKLEINWIFQKQLIHEIPYPATTAGPQHHCGQCCFVMTLMGKYINSSLGATVCCGVCTFFPCLHWFSLGISVSSHILKRYA